MIADQARQHSRNMAAGATAVGHDGFSARLGVIAQTIPHARAAENVSQAGWGSSGTAVVNDWLNSAVHKANIEGDFDFTGVGVATGANSVYFTQIFIKSR